MTVALPLSAGRNLSFDIFFIKDFKAARCLGVLSCLVLQFARMVVVWCMAEDSIPSASCFTTFWTRGAS